MYMKIECISVQTCENKIHVNIAWHNRDSYVHVVTNVEDLFFLYFTFTNS